MAADCEQTRAQMLELLDGELAPSTRAELDAHVKGCPECRAELAALESTRAMARHALAADVPPPRARAAILQAAAAAVAARKPATAAARPSWWERIRAKWTLPTFATIGAVAVFLLASRIFMEPEKTYERGRQGVVPAETEAPAVRPAEEAKSAAPPPPALKREVDDHAADRTAPAAPARRRAQPARPAGAARPQAERPNRDTVDGLLEGTTPAPATRAFAPPPPPAPERREEREERDEGADRAARLRAGADDVADEAPSRGTTGAGAPRAAAPSAAPAAKKANGPVTAESPVARADRLFAQRRWTQAAIAYRELLRDDPHSPDAARWRQRLAACEAAASTPPPAF